MGHKIRAQLGKTNISGDGNNITQIGYVNQNNSNNITHNHYHGKNQESQSNSGGELMLGFGVTGLLIFLIYCLFKYGDYIVPLIKFSHVIILFVLVVACKLYKNEDFDKKDFLNFFCVLGVGIVSFLCAIYLFSISEFNDLVEYAQNKTFIQYWHMKREWKVISIYFFIGTIVILFLLTVNIIYTISFWKYSNGSRKQSNLVLMFLILVIAIFAYYILILNSGILLNVIRQIKFI